MTPRQAEPVPQEQQQTAAVPPAEPHSDGREDEDEDEEEEAAGPAQPSNYGRYSAEARQASSQQMPERRTYASIEPGSEWDAHPPSAAHATWRLRRPGNGFVLLKAKGTAGLSILFTADGRSRDDYYEVRLGQRGVAPDAAAGSANSCIAKVTRQGGMQFLGQPSPGREAVIGESTAQGYTAVWVATAGGCWVVGLGSRLFEREVMRGADPQPLPAERFYISFRAGAVEGSLELRDIHAGKALSQPSPDYRHVLHVRAKPAAKKRAHPDEDVQEDSPSGGGQMKMPLAELLVARGLAGHVVGALRPLPIPGLGTAPAAHPELGKSFLAVCPSASAAAELCSALAAESGSSGGWEARSLLDLLAEGWGGLVGFVPPKVRNSRLDASGVQNLVGRALER